MNQEDFEINHSDSTEGNFERFSEECDKSLNAFAPKEVCTVKYNDLDHAIKNCLAVSKLAEQSRGSKTPIYLGKTDASNAFRMLPLRVSCICWLVFKAENPKTGKVVYFVDKCLPFGTSISCAHCQRFSNSLRHILQHRTGVDTITNYLDDFLLAYLRSLCNQLIRQFSVLCSEIGVPVAEEKTEWAMTVLVFLGILLDGRHLTLSLPIEKQEKALKLLIDITNKKKATINQIQTLTGYLNFLTKGIYSSRIFTRRMYAKCTALETNKRGIKLKPHHHVALDNEFKFDCHIWVTFLLHYRNKSLCTPMTDMDESRTVHQLNFYSDTSTSPILGFGAIFDKQWLFVQWEVGYIQSFEPNIEYLEL